MSNIRSAVEIITNKAGKESPKLGIVLGSGLGALSQHVKDPITIPFSALPGFPISGVSGHEGSLIIGTLAGTRTAILSGRVHYYENGDAQAMHAPLNALAEIGCPAVALSNAAGSTREHMPPGSLMVLQDHLNWSGLNPLFGADSDRRFVDMSQAYDGEFITKLGVLAQNLDIAPYKGTYAWYSGPSFETPAEINASRILGADAVGMSTVPEVILARYFKMKVAAVSVITNFAAGMVGAEIGHDHTKIEAEKAQKKFCELFMQFAASFTEDERR